MRFWRNSHSGFDCKADKLMEGMGARFDRIDSRLLEIARPSPSVPRFMKLLLSVLALAAVAVLICGLHINSNASEIVSLASTTEQDATLNELTATHAEVTSIQAEIDGNESLAASTLKLSQKAEARQKSEVAALRSIDLGGAFGDESRGILYVSLSSVFLGAIAGYLAIALVEWSRTRSGTRAAASPGAS